MGRKKSELKQMLQVEEMEASALGVSPLPTNVNLTLSSGNGSDSPPRSLG